MRTKLVCLILLILTTGCQPVRTDEYATPASSPSPRISQTVPVQAFTSFPTQEILLRQTPEISDENKIIPIHESDSMPIFLEVTQTTIMGENAVLSSVIGIGPIIYFYDPDNRILSLNTAITLESTTELLVGIKTVLQTSREIFEKREIIQYPAEQSALIQTLTLDTESGKINLIYADETFSLSPGEGRTFKQVSDNSKTPIIVIMISNHGYLTGIQSVFPNGSWR